MNLLDLGYTDLLAASGLLIQSVVTPSGRIQEVRGCIICGGGVTFAVSF